MPTAPYRYPVPAAPPAPADVVAAVVRPGYLLHDRVLRAAQARWAGVGGLGADLRIGACTTVSWTIARRTTDKKLTARLCMGRWA